MQTAKIDYLNIDWKATRKAMKAGGMNLMRMAIELEVSYGSLNQLLTGNQLPVYPEASKLVVKTAQGMLKHGFLVYKEK